MSSPSGLHVRARESNSSNAVNGSKPIGENVGEEISLSTHTYAYIHSFSNLLKKHGIIMILICLTAKRLAAVEWLNSIFPSPKLSLEATEEELRAFLKDGTIFYTILYNLRPGLIPEVE